MFAKSVTFSNIIIRPRLRLFEDCFDERFDAMFQYNVSKKSFDPGLPNFLDKVVLTLMFWPKPPKNPDIK